MKLHVFSLLFLIGWGGTGIIKAQDHLPLQKALEHISSAPEKWGLTREDVADLAVSDLYLTRHNQVTHVYLLQRYQGIEVRDAIFNVAVTADGRTFNVGHRFEKNLASRITGTTPAFNAQEALEKVVQHLGLKAQGRFRIKEKPTEFHYVFEPQSIASRDIHVKLDFLPVGDNGQIHLAWRVDIDPVLDINYWSIHMDALNGQLLEQFNYTLTCNAGGLGHREEGHVHSHECGNGADIPVITDAKALSHVDITAVAGETYNVFPLPLESPQHGPQTKVTNPAHPEASPYGWHDTNGQPGPEYTITRGNNTHAYADPKGIDASSGDEPDGGSTLAFDYAYSSTAEPLDNVDAAVTNLFYWTNTMHDFAYQYGFDEVAGNFQRNNYGKGGAGNDPMIAEAVDGMQASTPTFNNAFYSGGADGQAAGIHMFAWERSNQIFHVDAPADIARGFQVGTAQFGPAITTTAVTGLLVEAEDITVPRNDACQDIKDPSKLAGKVALVQRGTCFFQEKVLKVQNAGAVACVICNFEEQLINMSGSTNFPAPTIPAVSLRASQCAFLRENLDRGVQVRFQLPPTAPPPALVDGDFDNGIIAHEYGHGISIRLTGGPSTASCLGNAEQMGEGWSDFFTLVTSIRKGDTRDTRRGVGSFATREPVNGGTIRRYPYTTDINVNPHTLASVAKNTEVHALGEVWTTVLWDLYWAFVDKYGFDEDLIDGTGGNNIAVRLVMDGMKLQPCRPGFIDGRDAILLADKLANGGINECMIWEVFAKRGMGYYSTQGSSTNAADQIEDFETQPLCLPELKISKSVTPLIKAGDQITVNVTVYNHKRTPVSGVKMTEELVTGLTYVAGSASNGVTAIAQGNNVVFTLRNMKALDTLNFSFKLNTDPNIKSISLKYDPMDDDNNYIFQAIEPANDGFFTEVDDAINGPVAYRVAAPNFETQQILQYADFLTVQGNVPVIRFWHKYITEPGFDGGIFEISENPEEWTQIDRNIFRGKYNGFLDYSSFTIPNLQGFHGNSNGWISSWVDVSGYKGKDLELRWNFGSDPNKAGGPVNEGWTVDGFELLDLKNYVTKSTLTSDQADNVSVTSADRGTLLEVDRLSVGINDPSDVSASFHVFPNPANESLQIWLPEVFQGDVNIQLENIEGKVLLQKSGTAATQVHTLQTQQLTDGMYLIRVINGKMTAVKKVLVRH